MTQTIRLTAAQAMVKYLAAQMNEDGDTFNRRCLGAFLDTAMWPAWARRCTVSVTNCPRNRGQNEQSMAHAAICLFQAVGPPPRNGCDLKHWPGATNMVTAAALAHVNRIPCLFIPGDVFANRGPDPVLQQVEDFQDGTISANDCFKPVSRYFDRITRPEQIITALPRAMATMTDPADCGPVTLAFCQDVQAEAYDYPEAFFTPRVWRQRRVRPDEAELAAVVEALRGAKNPVIVAGGGVHYSGATEELRAFAEAHQIPIAETQAGKSALPWDHPMNFGPIGVTGSASANTLCAGADVILGVGTRFQDFTTGSWSLFQNPDRELICLNVAAYDAMKRGATPLLSDAKVGLEALTAALGSHKAPAPDAGLKTEWFANVDPLTDAPADGNALPTDMQVVGAAQRGSGPDTVVMCAAGTMPGELHKLWKATRPMSYHMEYGFSCMGYEIAGAMGIKMADPDRDVLCMIGDGSYMMMNSELATACMMGIKFTMVITDNRGYGCINRLQMGAGGAEFNNLLDTAHHVNPSNIDFAAHAASMGATSVKVKTIAELEAALAKAPEAPGPYVVVIDTDPYPTTEFGGAWWEVGVPEVSVRESVVEARAKWDEGAKART